MKQLKVLAGGKTLEAREEIGVKRSWSEERGMEMIDGDVGQ